MDRILKSLTVGDWWFALLVTACLACLSLASYATGLSDWFSSDQAGRILTVILLLGVVFSYFAAFFAKLGTSPGLTRALWHQTGPISVISIVAVAGYYLARSDASLIASEQKFLIVMGLSAVIAGLGLLAAQLGILSRQLPKRGPLALAAIALFVLLAWQLAFGLTAPGQVINDAIISFNYQRQLTVLLLGIGLIGLAITLSELTANMVERTDPWRFRQLFASNRLFGSSFSAGWALFTAPIIGFVRNSQALAWMLILLIIAFAIRPLTLELDPLLKAAANASVLGLLAAMVAGGFGTQAFWFIKSLKTLPVSKQTIIAAVLLAGATVLTVSHAVLISVLDNRHATETLVAYLLLLSLYCLGFFVTLARNKRAVSGRFGRFWPFVHTLSVILILNVFLAMTDHQTRLIAAGIILVGSLVFGLLGRHSHRGGELPRPVQ